jgi:NADH-quinone oxidoreductase subunit E
MVMSASSCTKIEAVLSKFPADQRQSALISALMIVQTENNGYLTTELMDAVADYLQIPKIAAYEVASFYSMYEHKPVGKYKISLCTNISCMLCGAEDLEGYLKEKLNIDYGQVTQDGKFSLKQVECLAACGGAPMMQIGDQYYTNLTREKIDLILAELE